MSKKKKINKFKENTVRSVNNNIRSSVRKLNPILKGIVGKKVDVAIRDLQFSAKRITKEIRKTVSSAIANACLLYTSPSPRDGLLSRMPSSA